MAHSIPDYVMKHIASFLPYNERIEMNRALPFEYRLTKKLKSDEHNAQYKSDIIREKLIKFDNAPLGSVLRVNYIKKLMLYLLHTKDQCLFMYPNFRKVVIQKCREFSDIHSYDNLVITEWRAVKSTIRVATQLLSKVETTTFPDRKKKVRTQYIQIV